MVITIVYLELYQTRICYIMCLRGHLLCLPFMYLRAYVPLCFTYLRAHLSYVPVRLCVLLAFVPLCLIFLRAKVDTCFNFV